MGGTARPSCTTRWFYHEAAVHGRDSLSPCYNTLLHWLVYTLTHVHLASPAVQKLGRACSVIALLSFHANCIVV